MQKDHPIRIGIVCTLLSLVYFIFYGLYGLSDTDQGFIQALSWRIVQGETPYLDFIYVRPPFSIYLHSLPMMIFPEGTHLVVERILFYLMMGASVFLSTRSLQKYFDFREIGLSPEWFAVMAFMCSVHNFPPMPWHTIDGILFGAWGINRLVRGRTLSTYVGGLILLSISALCKQAFYPMLLFGPILLYVIKPQKMAIRAIAIWLGLNLILISLLLIFSSDWLNAFLVQTTGSTSFHDLWEIGFMKYAKPFLLIVLPLIVVWRAQAVYSWRYLPVIIFGMAFMGLLGLHVWKVYNVHEHIGPSYGFSQAFFLIAIGISIKGFWINPKAHGTLLAMLTLSWCSGLSWGNATPMLYFTPILFGFIYGLYEELDFSAPRYVYGIICFLLLWIFATLYQYPYRDAPREELLHRPGEIFPRIGLGICTGIFFYEKSKELDQLSKLYPDRFSVLPSFPLAHYLTDTRNPLPIDWAHNAEMGNLSSDHFHELMKDVNAIFVEKDKEEEINYTGKYGSLLTKYIKDNWTIDTQGQYFEVYVPPDSSVLE